MAEAESHIVDEQKKTLDQQEKTLESLVVTGGGAGAPRAAQMLLRHTNPLPAHGRRILVTTASPQGSIASTTCFETDLRRTK